MTINDELHALAEALSTMADAHATRAGRYRDKYGVADGFDDWSSANHYGNTQGEGYFAGYLRTLVTEIADTDNPLASLIERLHAVAESIGGAWECHDCQECMPLGELTPDLVYPDDLYCIDCLPDHDMTAYELRTSEHGNLAITLALQMTQMYGHGTELVDAVLKACQGVKAGQD